MFPPFFLNIIHLESTFVTADVRCDEKSISSKTYEWWYVYWVFGNVTSL